MILDSHIWFDILLFEKKVWWQKFDLTRVTLSDRVDNVLKKIIREPNNACPNKHSNYSGDRYPAHSNAQPGRSRLRDHESCMKHMRWSWVGLSMWSGVVGAAEWYVGY